MARNHVEMGRIIMCRGNVTKGQGAVWSCVALGNVMFELGQYDQLQVADFVARPY